jgi:hypothetical protein
MAATAARAEREVLVGRAEAAGRVEFTAVAQSRMTAETARQAEKEAMADEAATEVEDWADLPSGLHQ